MDIRPDGHQADYRAPSFPRKAISRVPTSSSETPEPAIQGTVAAASSEAAAVWQEADEDIPILLEARAEYENLQ